MTLQLEHIQGYLAHGLKVISGNGKSLIRDVVFEHQKNLTTITVNNLVSGIGHKPILRKLDLTKIITVNGVEIIPLLELAEIHDPNSEWNLNDMYPFVYSMSYEFQFIEGNFYMNDNSDESRGINNQLQLFKWLYANKFDVEGLVDAGLAIDAHTLETNPYNS